MTDNYFDVMKICELVNAEKQELREEEILKSHNYTKSRYEDELKKLVLEGKETVQIPYSPLTCNFMKHLLQTLSSSHH